MLRLFYVLLGSLLVGPLAKAQGADLTIWWTKGFYPVQDQGITQVVEGFQKETGTTVELDFYTQRDIPIKLQAALEAGQPPDVSNGAGEGNGQNVARLAFEGRFVDLTDVVEGVAKNIDPALLERVYLLNGQTGKRAYYS